MMHYLILHKTSRLKFSLADIWDPARHQLHLITLATGGLVLPEQDRPRFASVELADEWTQQSLSDLIGRAVSRWGTEHTRVITHDEYSMMYAARAREHFGLPGPGVEQISRFTYKPLMKDLVAAAGVRVPRFVRLSDVLTPDAEATADRVIEVTGIPAFAKQVAGTCSEGARRLGSRADLIRWLTETPGLQDFEVDEFLTGELLHVDCVIQGGRAVHAQTTADTFPNAETLTDKPLGALTLPPDSKLGIRMLEFNADCLAALAPLVDGTTHLEFFRTPADELVFLEIAARSPGGDCPRQYEVNSGINFQSVFFRTQLGLPVTVRAAPGPFAAWCWYPWGDGRVTAVRRPALSAAADFESAAEIGMLSHSGQGTRARAARVFATSHDFATLAADFDYLRYEYEPVSYAR